ncbi:hypothetical protein pkur_cds_591 [Pandoravirus kuranda]|uniref:Uncharacterized protein n=1 Tax=Pandoravirus kuranda TaxID=3019033 RepID=A0AA95EDE6_9VIRU|nr:hypothetical protein pkur_cds_591 [Pandoravirus kuranda]
MDVQFHPDRPLRDLCLLLAARIAAADKDVRNGLGRATCHTHGPTRCETDTRIVQGNHITAEDSQPAAADDDPSVEDGSVGSIGRRDDNGATEDNGVQGDPSTPVAPPEQGKKQEHQHSTERPDQSINNEPDDAPYNKERLLVASILDRCPEGAQRPLSAWAPMIDAFVGTLPTEGAPLLYGGGSGAQNPTHSTATAAAALVRLLPALEAHGLDNVYAVVIRPENVDDVSGPWDAMNPLAEAYCGLGQWLVHVECGRKWYDDVHDGQELAGGVIAIRHLVHRHTHVCVTVRNATLGQGYDATTQDYLAFMRSGLATPEAFVDAVCGHVCDIPRVLSTSFGWSITPGQPQDRIAAFCKRRRSINSTRYTRRLSFTRASDNITVCVCIHDRTILVGRSQIDPPTMVPVVSLFDLPLGDAGDDQHQQQQQRHPVVDKGEGVDGPRPRKVPRPHADYTNADPAYKRMRKAARRRAHADRDYLVGCGLLDPMHLTLGNSLRSDQHWPCVGFRLAPRGPVGARAEDVWYRRLAVRMDEVADLIRADTSGAFGFDVDREVHNVVIAAGPRLQDIVCSLLTSKRRIDGQMLDAMIDNMLSPIVVSPWRIFRPDRYVTRGSRFIDPPRGLYLNWRFRCNFVPDSVADGLAHARFYGHILVVATDPAATGDMRSRPVTVAGYYALSVREPRSIDTYEPFDSSDNRSSDFFDMDEQEAAAVAGALATVDVSTETRFGPDEPHHVISHYRDREFAPIPRERFRGILHEDAMRIDGAESAGARIIQVFDWMQKAFDRHATVFGVSY